MEKRVKLFYVVVLAVVVLVLGAFVMKEMHTVQNNYLEVIAAHGTIITDAV